MPTPHQIISTGALLRTVRRDALKKERLYRGVAPYIGAYAFDAAVPEMTAEAFAERVLRKLGLISPDDPPPTDPITALESWLAGKQRAADVMSGTRGMDSAPSSGFMSRYLKA